MVTSAENVLGECFGIGFVITFAPVVGQPVRMRTTSFPAQWPYCSVPRVLAQCVFVVTVDHMAKFMRNHILLYVNVLTSGHEVAVAR